MESQARRVADRIVQHGQPFIGWPPAPSMISGVNYSVSYYDDKSILICVKGHAPIVLDEERTYYREDVEHLASCLGMFTQEARAAMLKDHTEDPVWIDGVCWNLDGSFAAV